MSQPDTGASPSLRVLYGGGRASRPGLAGLTRLRADAQAAYVTGRAAKSASGPTTAQQGTSYGGGLERVIDNPIGGERIVIRESGALTGGRLLAFDLFLPSRAHVPAGHVHPEQEERFTVVAGRIRFRLGRRTIVANAAILGLSVPSWNGPRLGFRHPSTGVD